LKHVMSKGEALGPDNFVVLFIEATGNHLALSLPLLSFDL
jgi:hypothetical protein